MRHPQIRPSITRQGYPEPNFDHEVCHAMVASNTILMSEHALHDAAVVLAGAL